MIPPTILGCRIFQAHDVSKLCGLVFFAVVTGHCWHRRPVASCWGREAGRRLWVIHLVGYRLDRNTVADENHGR